ALQPLSLLRSAAGTIPTVGSARRGRRAQRVPVLPESAVGGGSRRIDDEQYARHGSWAGCTESGGRRRPADVVELHRRSVPVLVTRLPPPRRRGAAPAAPTTARRPPLCRARGYCRRPSGGLGDKSVHDRVRSRAGPRPTWRWHLPLALHDQL